MQMRIPIYVHGEEHQAFVRYELSTWPDTHDSWVVYCPACRHMAIAISTSYQHAYDMAIEHRLESDSWLPPDALAHGPVRLWGPSAGAALKRSDGHPIGPPEEG